MYIGNMTREVKKFNMVFLQNNTQDAKHLTQNVEHPT